MLNNILVVNRGEIACRVFRTGFMLAARGARRAARGARHKARVLPARVAPYAPHLTEMAPPDLSRFLLAPPTRLLVRIEVVAGQALAVRVG